MNGIKAAVANLQAYLATLTQRERRLVFAGAAGVVAFIVFIITFSIGARADAIRARLKDKVEKLEQVQELAATFRDAEGARQMVEQSLRASNVRLTSYVEEKGQQAGVAIPSITPKGDVNLDGDTIVESSVEVTLTDVPLNRFGEFLTSVEAGPGVVKVKYMRIEPRPANENLSAWVTIATYRMKN